MSPKLRRLSGSDVIGIFGKFGFAAVSQRGSHIKLVRTSENEERQILTIPNHKELDTGTLQSIVRQASKYIDTVVLKEQFYTE